MADPLELADPVLDGFYQAVFRTYLDRLRGPDGATMADPPTELIPFLRFKAQRAVSQPQVRNALREVLAADEAFAAQVAEAFPRRRGEDDPTIDAVIGAAQEADKAALGRLASLAAATRPPGWDSVVAAAGAAASAVDAGLASGAALEARSRDAAERKSSRERTRLGERVTELQEQQSAATAELERLKSERAAQRSAAETATRRAEAAVERATVADADATSLRAERDLLAERVAGLEAALRGQEQAATAETAALNARIEALEAALIPDLEPHAKRLEELAEELRDTMRDMAAPPGERRARRRRTYFPKGILAASSRAVEWTLAQPGLLVVIDGYNVARQDARGWGDRPLADQRQNVHTRCCHAHRRGGADIRIVFDSSEPGGFSGRQNRSDVTVEFSGGPIADDRIVEIVEGLDAAVAVVVVTSDRELQDRVSVHGAATIRSDVFLEAIGAPLR